MLSIVLFIDEEVTEELTLQVIRLCDKIQNDPVSALAYSSNDGSSLKCIGLAMESRDKIDNLKSCVYLQEEGTNTVLVDGMGRIRGYYDIRKRDEIDRIAVEIDILLKNGEHRSQ